MGYRNRGRGRNGGAIVPRSEQNATYVRIKQPSMARLITVAGTNISFTPILLIGKGTGTWSYDTLPAGAGFDPNTGSIFGTVTTKSRMLVSLTYTEGSYSDTVIVPIYVVDQIDSVAGGNYSNSIKLSGTTYRGYRLTGNITADKQAFTFGSAGIVLDLNGYSVTYDNAPQPFTVTNPDFSTGNTTGWDTTGAPSVTVQTGTLVGRTAYNDGEYALRVAISNGQSQYFETTQTFALVAGECYSVSMWTCVAGTEGVSINPVFTIGTHSSSSLTGYDAMNIAHPYREGSFTIWTFIANSTETAVLRVAFSNSSGSSQTFCFSHINVDRARCHGMWAYSNSISFETAPYGDLTATIGGSHGVCNGSFIQANGSPGSNGLSFRDDPCVDNLLIQTNPRVRPSYGSPITCWNRGLLLTNSTLSETTNGIGNRDNRYGFLISAESVAAGSNIGIHIRDNRITNSSQGGNNIMTNTSASLAGNIRWNTGAMQSRHTNGFVIVASGISGKIQECSRNIVDLTQGATDAGRGIAVANYVTLNNNRVSVRVLPNNQEYTESNGYQLGGAYAMQLESTGLSVSYTDEYYYLTGNGGGACFRVNGNVENSVPITNCTFEVNSTTANPQFVAACIYLTYPDAGVLNLAMLDFQGCTLKTNRHLLNITGAGFNTTLTLTNAHIHLVDDAYKSATIFSVVSGANVVFVNPTYEDSYSQTTFETAVTADPRVSIQ